MPEKFRKLPPPDKPALDTALLIKLLVEQWEGETAIEGPVVPLNIRALARTGLVFIETRAGDEKVITLTDAGYWAYERFERFDDYPGLKEYAKKKYDEQNQ